MHMSDHPRGSFFGRRVGKPLREQRRVRFETAIGRLKVDLAQPAPADLRDLFDAPVTSVWLEIGFGGGEHLLHEASRLTDTGFIGVEPFVNSLAKTVVDVDEAGLGNVRLYDDDAVPLLDWLPDGSLDGIYQLLSRPLAQATPLEAPFRQPGEHRPLRPRPEAWQLLPFRQRHRYLCRVDARPLRAADGFCLDSGVCRGLARALAAVVGNPLRRQGLP